MRKLIHHNQILNYIFEVPAKYIGERIKVRYDLTSLDKVFIFDDNGNIETNPVISKLIKHCSLFEKYQKPEPP
ncbi:MAG: Mu transposase C-terminal domain-containing protein [Caloramator sp.]|nr:Mu transposase C-terminal domain-containing protein [Caloramator sp.]